MPVTIIAGVFTSEQVMFSFNVLIVVHLQVNFH